MDGMATLKVVLKNERLIEFSKTKVYFCYCITIDFKL